MLENLPPANPVEPEAEPLPIVTPAPPKPGWLDLLLYLFCGLGLFMLATLPLGLMPAGSGTVLTALVTTLNFIFLAGCTYWLGVRRGKFTWEEIGFRPIRMKIEWLILGGILTITLLFFRMAVGVAFVLLFPETAKGLEARQQLLMPEFSLVAFLVSLVGAGVLAPFSEELFFRGAIYQWFRKRYGYLAAVAGSSILFGLAHFDASPVVIASFIMGVALAIVYEKTRSIWLTILMHALNNSLAVLISYTMLALLKLLGMEM